MIKYIKQIRFNTRIKAGLILIVLAIVINHLTSEDNLPSSDNYIFPLLTSISSIIIGFTVLLIAEVNFLFYKRKHFVHKVESKVISNFLFSSLAYVSVLYIPIYVLTVYVSEGTYNYYDFFLGLTITLMMSALSIIILYAKPIYGLHKHVLSEGKLQVRKSGKNSVISNNDILYFYSENKVVYLVKNDGNQVLTDFTLSQLEDTLHKELFYRANRQMIIHYQSIESYTAIENGKIKVVLKPLNKQEQTQQIIVSRYKKETFLDWFQSKA